MNTRRDFLKNTALITFAAGLNGVFPASLKKAFAINPKPGSTFLDAKHVVVLMQENRSFDHCFGTLQGVRGFADPRSITLPDGLPVWFQTDKEQNKSFVPFHLDIKKSRATWMGSLPHSRSSQIDAFNEGRYDNWLDAKRFSNKDYRHMPFALGYYNREDIPFNYALADTFTICDQNFSSAMSSTWPNRHFMWTGNIREIPHDADSRARIRNDLNFGEAKWRTFPELLQKHDISWRIYQNDLTCGGGFEKEERIWLSNFTCNALEYFKKFNVKYSDRYVNNLKAQAEKLPKEIENLETVIRKLSPSSKEFKTKQKTLVQKRKALKNVQFGINKWSQENFDKLNDYQKELYNRAFTTNKNDENFRKLMGITYEEGAEERELKIPAGDILYQFRNDVKEGKLPTVSWLIPPKQFSDHPSAPWYGSWYVSEILNILTQNPEVWKETIFIITYDENDGYFDHIPPFMPPMHNKPQTGKCSAGIDTAEEYISKEQELAAGVEVEEARAGMIGLGYRVPMIVASPWSRGGRVNSQVFDHTSIIRFLEVFLSHKKRIKIKESNISTWRRTIVGDLTSVFSKYDPESQDKFFLDKIKHIEGIYNAKFKEMPDTFGEVSDETLQKIRRNDRVSSFSMPIQERGVRPSCTIPYQYNANFEFSSIGDKIGLKIDSSTSLFGSKTAGVPLTAYFKCCRVNRQEFSVRNSAFSVRHYAMRAGDGIEDEWQIKNQSEENRYDLSLYGPNGFLRQVIFGNKIIPLNIECAMNPDFPFQLYFKVANRQKERTFTLQIKNHYKKEPVTQLAVDKSTANELTVNTSDSHGWYDIEIEIKEFPNFRMRYAGRLESGKDSITDPVMGGAL